MTTPHIHADALRALADGKQLQWRWKKDSGEWCNIGEYYLIQLVTGNKKFEFRVKPERKWYRVAILYRTTPKQRIPVLVSSEESERDFSSSSMFSHWSSDRVYYDI